MAFGRTFAHLVQSGDYMNMVCAKCDGFCETDLTFMYGHIPILKVTCPNCGVLSDSKLGPKVGLGFLEKLANKRASA